MERNISIDKNSSKENVNRNKTSSKQNQSKKWKFWCDRGGTFTDVIGISPRGQVFTEKLLSSNPDNYQDSTEEGIRRILKLIKNEPIPENLVESIRIGTTIGTNALLEKKGEPTVLITTKGFEDALKIGYQNRPDLFALEIQPKKILYKEVLAIEERLNAEGEVVKRIDEISLEQALITIIDKGIYSAAVVFMHSYLNPIHELIVERLARQVGFRSVSLSHQTAQTIKFVARGETTCVDAYLTPILQEYTSKLSKGLGNIPLQFMQSHGGLVTASFFRGKHSVLSGPAGGVVGAAHTARKNGLKKIIGFDMGGTSTDVCHYSGHYERTFENEVNGFKLNVPMMSINTVAAGGGSIIEYDGIKMCVGPGSAGSNPGPTCYQKGGPLTVTDCNVLLGTIRPEYFPKTFGASNNKSIDKQIVLEQFSELTEKINQDKSTPSTIEEIADGFLKIAVDKMANAIRKISIQKGIGLENYSLNCFGGAAGQHACQVADSLNIKTILIDKNASLLSALGMGCAETREIKEETTNVRLDKETLEDLQERIQATKEEVSSKLRNQGFGNEKQSIAVNYRLKYEGTDDSIEVSENGFSAMKLAFEQQHLKRYGFFEGESEIIVSSITVEGMSSDTIDLAQLKNDPYENKDKPSPIGKHQVFLTGKKKSIPFFDGDRLKVGLILKGPLVVITKTNTILVEPFWELEITKTNDFLLRRKKDIEIQTPQTTMSAEIELFSNQIMSVAEQMGVVFQKTARSVNIKERLDLSCAVFDEDGCLLANAPHIPVHLGSMSESVKNIIQNFQAKIKPGDVYMTNDPFNGGTHLPDLTTVTPVFVNQRRAPLFFVGSRGHHADIGGITPGSMPATSTRIEQEGVLLENLQIVRENKFQENFVRDTLTKHQHPVRNIENNVADIKASLAANKRGVDELLELTKSYGIEKTRKYIDRVKNQGEQSVSDLIKSLSPGSSEKLLDGGETIKVDISIDKKESLITIDFEGTSGQTNNNLNTPISITKASVLYVLRTLIKKEIPLNEGCLRPVRLIIPEGSILNPSHPAAVVAGNVETSQNIVDCLYEAFGQLAASQGTMNNITFGNEKYQYYETLCGGTGAGPHFNGCDAVHCHMTNSRLTDPEVLEARFPVMLCEFAIRPKSGGSGQFKGGNGVTRKIQFFEKMMVSILSSHRINPPAGIHGGMNGQIGQNKIVSKDKETFNLKGIDQIIVQTGDTLWIETPGGGGYGAPK